LLRNANYELRTTNYEHVWLSGNIGDQPLLTILDQIAPNDVVVLELSSFQIEQLADLRKAPHVALLTNLTPNHLDRYGTFEVYCAAKESIFRFQPLDGNKPAVSIFNAEDKVACQWFEKYSGQAGRTCLKFTADDVSDEIRGAYVLPGRANLSNLAAAMAIAWCFGVADASVRDCLAGFKALPHRLELIAEIAGVRWYNDSKATTPQGTMVALNAFDCPQILIAGGYDKHLPFDELSCRIAEKAKAAILIGQTAQKIAEAIKEHKSTGAQGHKNIRTKPRNTSDERATRVEIVNSLAEAVDLARHLAVSGDVVVLSPACASYDMFENYQQRGRQFAGLVRRIQV
jgi:UDP-N-acetylmuramoylalanine--D-glutamate ligase